MSADGLLGQVHRSRPYQILDLVLEHGVPGPTQQAFQDSSIHNINNTCNHSHRHDRRVQIAEQVRHWLNAMQTGLYD